MSDLGLFGPQSITWRVHGEPILLIGGLRALLLQALHPEAMRVLHAASNFQDDPWARLQRTAIYVGTLSFAPTERATAAAARVRGVHRRLGIDDPEQLAWVHACEVDSFAAAARAAGVGMTDADLDTYLREQRVAAELVGVPADLVPTSATELRDYFTAMRPRLAATPEARSAARMVIAPPMPVPGRYQLPARLGWTTVASLAVGLLPAWARRHYRLPPAPGAGLATAATMRALRLGMRPLPAQWREGPLYREAKTRAADQLATDQLATGSASPSHG